MGLGAKGHKGMKGRSREHAGYVGEGMKALGHGHADKLLLYTY